MQKQSKLEMIVQNRLERTLLGKPDSEYQFHPTRKWRFDFAYPKYRIAVEAEGGIWVGGAHSRGAHFNSDSEKYNEAVKLGWRVLRYTSNTIDKIVDDINFIVNQEAK